MAVSDRPRLILHAGLHKTGTTAIQSFAGCNRDELRRRGIWYPTHEPVRDIRQDSHNRLAHSLARTGKSGLLSDQEIHSLARHWRENVRNEVVLLSAEAASRHLLGNPETSWFDRRVEYLRQVSNALSDFDVEVVVVLRRQDQYLHSTYLEHIMKMNREASLSFDDFRSHLESLHLQYEKNLDAFESCFDRIRVLIYDDLRVDGRMCSNFFSEFGIDVSDLPDPGIVRRSLSPPQARAKRAIRMLILTKGINRQVNRLFGSAAGRWLADQVVSDSGCGFWRSVDARERWQRRYDVENERIRRRFLPGRSGLFAAE